MFHFRLGILDFGVVYLGFGIYDFGFKFLLSIDVGFSLRLGDRQIILASRRREAKKLWVIHQYVG